VNGGESCYLQQQNFSLEALAKRDQKPDPFAADKPAAPAAPKPKAKGDPEDAGIRERRDYADWNKGFYGASL
jgi:hypothetical protein